MSGRGPARGQGPRDQASGDVSGIALAEEKAMHTGRGQNWHGTPSSCDTTPGRPLEIEWSSLTKNVEWKGDDQGTTPTQHHPEVQLHQHCSPDPRLPGDRRRSVLVPAEGTQGACGAMSVGSQSAIAASGHIPLQHKIIAPALWSSHGRNGKHHACLFTHIGAIVRGLGIC